MAASMGVLPQQVSPQRILKMGRLRLRDLCCAHDEFLLEASAQDLRKLTKLVFPQSLE
jgi:hypothetical protein